MKKKLKKRLLLVLLVVIMVFNTACSSAQDAEVPENTEPEVNQESESPEESEKVSEAVNWPEQPINIMVPASAGGGTDIITRSLAEKITEKTGEAVVITNMTGLAGYEKVRVSEPNGYNYAMVITGLLISKAQGDLDFGHEEFDAIGLLINKDTTGFIVREDSPYQTLGDLFEAIKNDPQSATGGISMTGYPYLLSLAIEDSLDMDMYCVDAGNTAERNTALLGGQVDFIISNAIATNAYLESGDFRYLAIPFPERNPFLQDVPTFIEEGYDFTMPAQSMALMAPKGTDPEILDKFNEVINEILVDEEFAETMKGFNVGLEEPHTREQATEVLDNAAATFSKYVE